ncbi:DNA-binding transcriptional regulator, MarR family [Psychrobacillus psychrotolerans]|uniref:DNA-binding transcriptional regulator, MarR family n=2 Tax=Psychrobacillus psychrotolerans TaxID=126156 RepID=A0A1I6AVM3_9BACI|nr:DNA-binding transcriptional regulator, MarR family [Psychrobacillus psychrotolerans]
MNFEINDLDLFDLISERNLMIRKVTEELWNSSNDIYISNSEWFIIARIYKKNPTISSINKQVNITRQATHKFIRSLESKGLVEVNQVTHNKKEKCIRLTTLGEACYEKNESLKAGLEKKIADQIDREKLDVFKEILKLDWGI